MTDKLDLARDEVRDIMRDALPDLLVKIKAADRDYARRYDLVLQAVSVAHQAGYEAGFRIDPAEPEWPVAFIELPEGQASWHLPQHPTPWDGHTTEEKFRRIDAHVAAHPTVSLESFKAELTEDGWQVK